MTSARAAKISIADALRDPRLFGTEQLFRGASWDLWRAVMKAAFGEALTASELEIFRAVAGREPPAHRVKELVAIAGRGAGKDSIASLVAAFVAMSFDPRAAKLRPGERVYVLCIATDKMQAELAHRMIAALFEEIPTLRAMLVKGGIGSDSIELKNRVTIEVRTNSYRSVRGRGILCCILDECAFYRDERGANPDVELHAAISPGLARVPDAMLILISSTHRRAGLLYDRWKAFYGRDDGDVLVVRGSTVQFNPTADRKTIDKAVALDPQRYGAEYNSEWRDDLATFLSRDLLDAAVEPGVKVRPPTEGGLYFAFVDPSGGVNDSFTMAIAHRELHNGVTRVVVDFVYERMGPFSPAATIEEIAAHLQRYRIGRVTGDRYAAEFVVEAFRKCKIEYRKSGLDRSEVYLGYAPLMAAGQVLLIDHPRAIAQFAGLVRRTFPSGKDRVDHELNAHDDLANAIAGAAVLASIDRDQKIPMMPPIVVGKSAPPSPGMSTTEAFYAWGGGDRWGSI
jgi:hypothetical protein